MQNIRNKFKRELQRLFLLTCLILGICLPAKAIVIEMSLLIDGSGSVGLTDFNNQMLSYKTVFSNSFHTNFLNPGDQLYVSAYQFATNVTLEQSTFLIDSDASASAFGDVLGSLIWDAGWTNTGAALIEASNDLMGNGINAERSLIHMVTDGNPCLPDHLGGCPQSVGQLAPFIISNDLQVSAIGVGDGLNPVYIESVTAHLDLIDNYASLQSTLVDVFARDLYSVPSSVPEPSSVLLVLSALGMLTVGRRRIDFKKTGSSPGN
ncbi:MAG: VWA domain-containing protein [Gammaproteobacteria bacterium]|nr:VWA domain-containing protein [Gammaproteobacteria bacterium]